ncbi:class I SAM-dependent rRNA methyltransferase [Clostridium cylindrosporum]|uniref:Ribosomal RNA large subunit methyltransferase I n=1 Tax=Clostridium cylindrosporum DSM 605 TaxID=1121307 RepID=A0A0J8DFV4_CLOCY|nr:class I SAM-dependent rRNA methyltransferase [Clostridium cylindrosporum]KMT23119.1 ribosomal RNA large subunit methyltransferase I [Clostridium cylindrosporum DSM 605]
MTKITLKSNIRKRVEKGHPWVYDNEIDKIEGEYSNGDIVDVLNPKGKFIGRGYINDNSTIRVRIMTRNPKEEINREFFERRIKRAWEYRKKVVDTSSCRVIYGEADEMPGIIVDKFNDYLSIQTLTYGIDQYKDIIVDILKEVIEPKGIFERNDNNVRELEGLEQSKGIIYGDFEPHTIISENGIKMHVDIENGQKTGYFLDQRENRLAIKDIVKDGEVLDCFSHTGPFAMHAAYFGAKKVTAVDISEHAIETAKENAKLNGLTDKIDFVCANVFDLLREYQEEGKQFDVVILDPPAFTKSAKKIKSAYKGYKEINLRGMKLVKPGGFLVTASCSHYMSKELFREMLLESARDARKTIREVEVKTQAKDHPYLWNYEESLYLKFFILNVL